MILFLDFETTGKADFNKKARDPSQPHIVRASFFYRSGTLDSQMFDMIAKPEGWEIPKEASDIHGITTEIAKEIGSPESEIATLVLNSIKAATLVVGHNIQFDKFIARIAMRRYELITDADDEWWKSIPTFCTMRESTAACQLPGGRGSSYKWPTLGEAYLAATGETMKNAHDSVADVRACAVIYDWIKAGFPKPVKGES